MSNDDKALRLFVSDLIKEKGSDSVDPEDLTAALTSAIDEALLAALPDDSIKALDAANDQDPDAPSDQAPNLEQLLADAGIDQDQIISDVLKEFREAYLSGEYHG